MDEFLTDEEHRRLNTFFSHRKNKSVITSIDELHGMLSAVIAGPDLLHPNEWLTLIWSSSKPFHSMLQADQSVHLMFKMYKNILAMFQSGEPFEPLFRQRQVDKEHKIIPDGWCDGFLKGISLRSPLWRQYDDTYLKELLLPILALGASREDLTDETRIILDGMPLRHELTSWIPDSVTGIYAFWRRNESGSIREMRKIRSMVMKDDLFLGKNITRDRADQSTTLH